VAHASADTLADGTGEAAAFADTAGAAALAGDANSTGDELVTGTPVTDAAALTGAVPAGAAPGEAVAPGAASAGEELPVVEVPHAVANSAIAAVAPAVITRPRMINRAPKY
jgi:hypothetical protein